MTASDTQSLFSARIGTNDFLTAGKLEDGTGLCLSGGGYRAMLYHAGALRRLNELGWLPQLREVASVSGGSITAGVLATSWSRLAFNDKGQAENLEEEVVAPIMRFAGIGIDVRAVLLGLLPGRTAADGVAEAYDRFLFRGATLQDLPDRPRFTFMATNLQTGSGWRFSKDYAADYRVGRIVSPRFSLSRVVAASSAFPPVLSPARFDLAGHTVEATEGADLHRVPFTERAVLTDGGVYDNLGLERVWIRCRTVLVSNAGKTIPEIGKPTGQWFGQLFRTLSLIQQQAENSRRRLLFGAANAGQRRVVYWSIDATISSYEVADAPAVPDDACRAAAAMRTRLNPFTAAEIDLLLRVGYAGADASLCARGLVSEGTSARSEQASGVA